MKWQSEWKLVLAFYYLIMAVSHANAHAVSDPCSGDTALLNLIDRPTAADSACAVPFKQAILELGYEYQSLYHALGYGQNYPEMELRIGLPASNELSIWLLNYINYMQQSQHGTTANVIGIKHEIGYTSHWLGAVEALFTLPNGSAAFGSKKWGAAINGIVSYTVNSQFNITAMLGASTQSQPSSNNGKQFTSFNPDIVLTYAPIAKLNLYGEIFGQTKTGPGESSGFNFDGGIIYLLHKSVAIDFEAGQRISGHLGGFNYYIGGGLSVLLS